MASEIAHIVYNNVFFQKLDLGEVENLILPENKINREEFMLGSIFPDIRRIGNIKRSDTHLYFPRVDLDFSGLDSFHAGWKFHLYCDMKREEILNKYNFYSLERASIISSQASKNLEDELVYNDYGNWEKMSLYFQDPPYFPVLPNINEATFRLWYSIVSTYITQQPNNKTIRLFLIKQQNYSEKVGALTQKLDEFRKNKKIREILVKIKDEII